MQLSTVRRALAAGAFLGISLIVASATAQIKAGGGTVTSSTPGYSAARLSGQVLVPASSRPAPTDTGKKAHTNVRFITPSNTANPLFPPPYSGYPYETPGSLACWYALAAYTAGCNPLSTSLAVSTGGSKTIAIVDAFDNPEAAADLAYFSSQFGLPFSVSKFHVVYAGGYTPLLDSSGGWELESALDVEYAHAMAPNANIYLVESYDNNYTNLMAAVQEAINIVQCGNFTTTAGACGASPTGYGEVSMSWGGSEFSGQTTYDATFATANSKNVVFTASAGDEPGPIWPSTSPYVISVGGTTISRSLTNGNLQYEIGWDDGGSGRSTVEAEPSFQSSIPAVHAIANGVRATPDVAAIANPYTGVYVYDTFPQDYYYYGDWYIVGGTSVAAPVWAGVLNYANNANASWPVSTQVELTRLYNTSTNATTYGSAFKDIQYGFCNYYMSTRDTANWDLCTGLGSPNGRNGK
ncbi:S53 family peptidase [Occallatibacter riparius]|uniref:S53 family peptidase n=1 Tax=Occallatibacter riparius TaxID=1002689 RepID=A0A9J7BP88_9BACT|nr:S53 family peptidase [Occallatibacter riparius]UWZ84563.1 S53 family peptidase [Occallatibacter riparius]